MSDMRGAKSKKLTETVAVRQWKGRCYHTRYLSDLRQLLLIRLNTCYFAL